MQPNALTLRLLVLATFWSVLVLVVAGIALTAAYRRTAEADFASRLEFSLLTLVAAASFDEAAELAEPPELADPVYGVVMSGWYWQITRLDEARVIARAPSLAGETLTMPDLATSPLNPQFRRFAIIDAPRGEQVSAIEQRIVIGEEEVEFAFLLTGSRAELLAGIQQFRGQIVFYLGLFGFGLVAITMAMVAWVMRPLRRIRAALSRVVSGEAGELQGDFPSEIAPLVGEINALIAANRRTVERARTLAGNLAHALKTPISVLRNESANKRSPLAKTVCEQTATMERQVSFHLDRARMAAQSRVIGVATPVRPSLDSLARAMQRIHAERQISLNVTCPDNLQFRGEKQDLDEILGNLIDNAHKWAAGRVDVTVLPRAGTPMLRLAVDDDGKGLSSDERDNALERGRRFDEATPGTGLGLSIVDELVTLYGGELALEESPLGGLRVAVSLPRIVAEGGLQTY